MKIKYRYVPRSKDKTHYLDPHSQPVTDFLKAIHFNSIDDDYAQWLLGRYGPPQPFKYEAVLMKITYEIEEVEANV
ncbi:hypothetical protein [Paenibacillus dakarensis]|uniref:hypothetical protein n=1 Tax=Paenibacillus dakarensis TaxID=1527293 RepID=UPI0006D573E1|nr:hypothetical protein [Paenibacillus dakarensis]